MTKKIKSGEPLSLPDEMVEVVDDDSTSGDDAAGVVVTGGGEPSERAGPVGSSPPLSRFVAPRSSGGYLDPYPTGSSK